MKRMSGKRKTGASHASTKYPIGVERKPLLLRSTFTPECERTLLRFQFEPKKQGPYQMVGGKWRPATTGKKSASLNFWLHLIERFVVGVFDCCRRCV